MFIRDAKRWLLPERTAPEYTAPQRARVARYVAAAALRLRLARDVSSSEAPVMPAVFLREAIALLMRAALAARDAAADGATLARLDTVAALSGLRRATLRDATDDERRVDEALTSRDPLYFDSLDDAELRSVYEALARESDWLQAQVDLRSSAFVIATRLGRIAALFVALAYFGHCAITSAFPPRNLALGKPVRLSSQEAGTPDPAGLVDGKKGRTYGAHTQVSQRPGWALIDLLHEADLKRIVVYNRGDSNLSDGLPYAIDLSINGTEFHEVARRDAPFGDGGFLSAPWTAAVHGRARYVRIRATWYLALSEVEVF
jgi:hypothetical protein